MLKFNILLFILLLVYYVSGRNVERGQIRRLTASYNFNHPPEAEYQSIPVAVVYEESPRQQKSLQSEKTIDNDVNKNEDSAVKNATTIEDAKEDFSSKSVDKSGLDKTKKPQRKEEVQIPVAVVYDPEPTNKVRPKEATNIRRKSIRRRGQRPKSETQQTVTTTTPPTTEADFIEERYSVTPFGVPGAYETVVIRTPKNTTKGSSPAEGVTKTKSTTESHQAENFTKRSKITTESTPVEGFTKRSNSTRTRAPVVPIVQSENVVLSQTGKFHYSYEGGDGTKAFEKGTLKAVDDENAGEAVSGGFSYTGKDGNEYSLSYTADENGYRPVGAHLPTPPPIPPAIARALAYLATKTTPETITESIIDN